MIANKLPKYIHPRRMADQNTTLSGSLPLSFFSRLCELTVDQQGDIALNVELGRDSEHFCYIKGTIIGQLPMECQRCLQAVNYDMQITFNLSPVLNEAQAKRLPSRYEPLQIVEDQVELLTMIEDELLLALPLVPMHETPDCQYHKI